MRTNRIDSKEKAFCLTWGDIEVGESDGDSDSEEAMLCFMVIKEDSNETDEQLTIQKWHEDVKKVIKEKHNILKNENSSLSDTNKKLCDEEEKLKVEVE